MKIKNLYFSPVKSLSFNNVDNLEIIKNIGIKNDRIFAFTNNLNLKDIELIKNHKVRGLVYDFDFFDIGNPESYKYTKTNFAKIKNQMYCYE